jgi:hypothetical protein
MGKMKELAIEFQEQELRPLMDDWGPIGPDGMEYTEYLHNPTSFMEIQYEESVDKLMGNYHLLTNEQIETINRIAKYL